MVPRVGQRKDLEIKGLLDRQSCVDANAALCLRLPKHSSSFPIVCALVPPNDPLRG
jgi:hypothetical protein